jgi:ABC-type glycerol-3-phosphate transport system substrate-binding protein
MKNAVKKILSVLLMKLMLSIVSVGGIHAAEKSVTFWMQAYGDRAEQTKAMDIIAKNFEKETSIVLNYEIIDWGNAMNKYSFAMKGGEAPDVAEWFFLTSFAEMGGDEYGPLQINDVAAEVGAENLYYDAAQQECKIGNDYYALPWRMDVRIMAYRKDMFEVAGITNIPTTWKGLIDTAQKLTKKSTNGKIKVSGAAYYITRGDFFQSAMATMAQNNTSVIDIGGTKSMINEQSAVESLQFMQDLVLKYEVMSPSHASATVDTMQEFLSGRIAILLGAGPDVIKMQQASAPQLDGKVIGARLPSKAGGNQTSSIMFAAPVSIMKTTKDVASAKTFLKFFMSDENQLLISKGTGLINANKRVMKDNYFKAQWYQALADQANFAKNGDIPVPFWAKISAFPQGPVANAVNKILAGADVQSEANMADQQIEQIIADHAK